MNADSEETKRRRDKETKWPEKRLRFLPLRLFVSLSLCLFIQSGCENINPFSRSDFYVPVTTDEHVYEIRSLDPADYSRTEPVTIEQAVSVMTESWKPDPILDPSQPLPLTLAEVRAAALANNLDLEVALYDPQVSETFIDEEEARFEAVLLGSARRSRFDSPTASQLSNNEATIDTFSVGTRIPLRTGGAVNIDLPVTRTQTNNIFSVLNPAYEADLSFSISQPLLRGAGVRTNTHGIRVAKYQKRIVDAQTKLEAIRILAAADRVYWRLYAAWEALDVARQQYDVAVEQLARSQRLVDAGQGAALDVTRAQSGIAQRLEAIIVAEREILERQRELKRVMNRDDLPINSPVVLAPSTEPNPIRIDPESDTLADFAVENRMEMLEQELQLAIDASTVAFEKNQALPLVVLDYTYNVNGLGGNAGNAFDLLADKSFEDWSVGLSVEVPVGNEAAEARVHRAILNRIQRLATKSQRELAIRQEVYDVLDRLETDWQRILAARQAVILAARVFESEQRIFDADDRTSSDVLDAAADLADAQLAEVRALVDYQVDQIDLAFATGTLLGHDRIRWDVLQPGARRNEE